MTATIRLERMLLRDTIAVPNESMLNYLLVKLYPASGAGPESVSSSMPLNVALVLDVSGSMYDEQRLEHVQAAVTRALDMLKPNDVVSIVAFGDDAKTVLPATAARDPRRIQECVATIGNVDVDPGGTSMHLGIQEGVRQIRANLSPGRLNRVIVLTDGQTVGEPACLETVRTESRNGITFSTVGVGVDWNESLLKGLAGDGRGNWHYIDSAAKALEVFTEEFRQLATTAFSNVTLSFRGTKDVVVKRARQVVPECMDVAVRAGVERQWFVDLGTMQNNAQRAILLDLNLPKRNDGQYVVGHVECKFDAPASNISGASSGAFDVRVTYNSDPSESYLNAQVAKYIDELQTFEVAVKIQTALAKGDQRAATMLANSLRNTATRLGVAGAKKTQLANQVLAELGQGGGLSRKTQLALQDGARKTELADPNQPPNQ